MNGYAKFSRFLLWSAAESPDPAANYLSVKLLVSPVSSF
jgi:hypothetical protein